MTAERRKGAPAQAVCELCGRSGTPLTRHHLIPRMHHRRNRTRRHYSRDAMRAHLLLLCRACHKQIHAILSERELVEGYATREALLAHPEIFKFVEWIRSKPPAFVPRTHAMRRRRP